MNWAERVAKKVRTLSDDRAREVLDFAEWLAQRQAEEDQGDLAEAREALAEAEKEGFIPWEQVKAEVGMRPCES